MSVITQFSVFFLPSYFLSCTHKKDKPPVTLTLTASLWGVGGVGSRGPLSLKDSDKKKNDTIVVPHRTPTTQQLHAGVTVHE